MENIDIDKIIDKIKSQALLHKTIDIQEYKNNLNYIADEEINSEIKQGLIYKVGKKIDIVLCNKHIYIKIRPVLVKLKNMIKKEEVVIDIRDFIKYDDMNFINVLYIELLNRKPDKDGLINNLNLLRQNKCDKLDIINNFIGSDEFRKLDKKIKLKNFKLRYNLIKVKLILNKVPILRDVTNTLIDILSISQVISDIDNFRKKNGEIISENIDRINYLQQKINDQNNTIEQLQNELIKSNCENEKKLEELKKEKDEQLALIRNEIMSIDAKISTANSENLNASEDNFDLDQFYINFENKFRGEENLITKRQDVYINKVKEKFDTNISILDLGCGRGEWIGELIKNGYKNVIGIDLNKKMVDECKEKGFEVVYGDAIKYLKLHPDNSFDFITGFQIIEHLEFKDKINFIKECYRVVKKDGVVLLETPNPENVFVGSCSFYTDLTHKNPVHPETLKFLFEEIGMTDTEIIRVNPLNYIDQSLVSGEVKHITFRFNMEQDYSVWGVK